MRAVKILVVLGAAAGVAAASAAVAAAGAGAGTSAPAARLQPSRPSAVGPKAADRIAIAYVAARHPGPGTARVLATESDDTDGGQPVWDVQVLAANGTAYEVHVSMASGAVLSAARDDQQVSPAPARRSERAGEDGARHAMDDTESLGRARGN